MQVLPKNGKSRRDFIQEKPIVGFRKALLLFFRSVELFPY